MTDYYNYINALNSCRTYNIQLKTPEYIEYEESNNHDIFYIRGVHETVNTIYWNFKHYQNYIFHNIRGPAIIIYYDDHTKLSESYIIRGNYHNRLGPAAIYYNKIGRIYKTDYYIDGENFGDEKHWKEAITLDE